MSQNNAASGHDWESQFIEDIPLQMSRSNQSEAISVFELLVNEDSVEPDGRNDISIVSNVPANAQLQLIQNEYVDLDTAINTEILNIDKITSATSEKDLLKYKVVDENTNPNENENIVVYGNPISQVSSTTNNRLVDKNDPRSRLHFVKYLKKDGKTTKIWECGICAKEFRHQYTLMRHLPTHTDERNFKCDACGKAFRQLSTLSQHKAIHSDARPYVCEFCKKTFNRVSTLISHRKTHSENKPHKCHLCGKGFHQKGNLRNHVFTHTNERPYKCELCGKGFNQMSNLVCHKIKAHAQAEKMQYICGICGKEFPRRFSLRAHEEYKHGIKYRQSTKSQDDSTSESTATKNKSVRIVRLPDGHRKPPSVAKPKDPPNTVHFPDCAVVDKIATKAMENAIAHGHVPFALFRPVKGVPVLVKILSAINDDKHTLIPATPEDLQVTGNMSSNPTLTTDADGVKTVQVKVPIVASITQQIDHDGKYSYLVESPEPNQAQDSILTPLDAPSPFTFNGTESIPNSETAEQRNRPTRAEDCDELLELAAQGGIQFVRATDDGRYEVMSSNEARELMMQNLHDFTILEGEAAEAINVANKFPESTSEVVMKDHDGRVIVLDPDVSPKPVSFSLDGIEFLDDKDIRIFDSKNLDDRFMDGITFLSPHSKIEDLVVCPKALEIENSLQLVGNNSDVVNVGGVKHPEPSMFPHRDDFPMNIAGSQCPLTTLLDDSQQHSFPILGKSPLYNYPKNIRSLNEDLNVLVEDEGPVMGGNDHPTINDYIEAKSKVKLDNGDLASDIISMNHPEMKILDACNQQTTRVQGDDCVKVFESQASLASNYLMSRYQEIKLLDDFARFSKNAIMNAMNFGISSDFDEETIDAMTPEDFRKKDEKEILNFMDDPRLAKIFDGERSTINGSSDTDAGCDAIGIGDSPTKREDHRHCFDKEMDSFFLLQSYSGPAEFLSFVSRSSPARAFENLDNRFEESCKGEQSEFPVMEELPDLE